MFSTNSSENNQIIVNYFLNPKKTEYNISPSFSFQSNLISTSSPYITTKTNNKSVVTNNCKQELIHTNNYYLINNKHNIINYHKNIEKNTNQTTFNLSTKNKNNFYQLPINTWQNVTNICRATLSTFTTQNDHLDKGKILQTNRRQVTGAFRKGRHVTTSFKRRSTSMELANEEKASRVLAFVFSSFFICWTPFFLSNFARGFCGENCAVPKWAESLFLWLGYTSSILNPIIYTTFNKRFRQAFGRILRCHCNNPQRQNFNSTYRWFSQHSTHSKAQNISTHNTNLNDSFLW